MLPSGHFVAVHILLSQVEPTQAFDSGLLQTLDLPWDVLPQVALQADHADQGPQRSSGEKNI